MSIPLLRPESYFDQVLLDAEPFTPAPMPPGPVERWQAWWALQAEDLAGDPLNEFAMSQGFAAGRAQLLRFGVRDSDQRRLVRRKHWSRPDRGVLSPVVVRGADHDARRRQHVLRSTAATVLRPDHVISGRSAAITYGLPTLSVPSQPVLTTWGLDSQGRRNGALVRAASLDAAATTTWFGAPIVTPARTIVELARADRRDGIMAADAALRAELVTQANWEVELVGAAGWPGVRQARDVLALADPAAESALESIVRLALHDDGFPPPELQFPIGDYRVDFCWPRWRLILEADGRGKYSDDALWREKVREAELRGFGYTVERIIWADVFGGWPAFSRRLRAQLRG